MIINALVYKRLDGGIRGKGMVFGRTHRVQPQIFLFLFVELENVDSIFDIEFAEVALGVVVVLGIADLS